MDCNFYCSEPFINRFCPPEAETRLPTTCTYTPYAWMRYPCGPVDGGISTLRKSLIGTSRDETHLTEKPVMEYSRSPAYHHQFHWGRCCPMQLYPGGRWSLYDDRVYILQGSQSLTHLCSANCPREVRYPDTRPFTSCSVRENVQYEIPKRPGQSALRSSYAKSVQSSCSTEGLQAESLPNPQLTADGEFCDRKDALQFPTANPCDQVSMYNPSPVTLSSSKECNTFFESTEYPSIKSTIKCRSRSLSVPRSSQVSECTPHPYAVTYICHPEGFKAHQNQPEECRNDSTENVGDCRARYEAFCPYTRTGKFTTLRQSRSLLRINPNANFPRLEDPTKFTESTRKAEFIRGGMTQSYERSHLGRNFGEAAYGAKTRKKEQAAIRKTPQSRTVTPRFNEVSHKPVDKVQSGLPAVPANAYSYSRQNKKEEEPKPDTIPAYHPVTPKSEMQGTPVIATPRVQSVESLKHNSVSQPAVNSELVPQRSSFQASEQSPKWPRISTAPPTEHSSSKSVKSDATRNFSEASTVASSGRTPKMHTDSAHQPTFGHASVSVLVTTPLYNWGSVVNPETKEIPGAPVPSEKILPLMSPENPVSPVSFHVEKDESASPVVSERKSIDRTSGTSIASHTSSVLRSVIQDADVDPPTLK